MLPTMFALFTTALVTSALLTPLVRHHAHRIGAVDHALSSRKVHARPTPRLGGIAIVAAFFTSLLASCITRRTDVASTLLADAPAVVGILFGGAAIALLGVYDDVRGASAKLKLVVHFGVAAIAYAGGFRVTSIANPFGPAIELGWLALPFTAFFVVGVINAINLIDGLDGLAGGVGLLCALTFASAAAMHGDTLSMCITAALAGALLGFLVYNSHPASIFMGDTGSMFLGVVLALTAIRSHARADGSVAIAAPLVALGVPVADTLLAITRRALRGAPLFRGDRGHIHHKLLATGLSHRGAVFVLHAATFVLGAAALVLGAVDGACAAGVAIVLALAVVVALHRLGYLDPARVRETFATRRRNARMAREMAAVRLALRRATREDEVRAVIDRAVMILDAEAASVELIVEERGERRILRVGDLSNTPPELIRSRHGLLAERPEKGFLELVWPREHAALGRDTEIAVETLSEQLCEALERVIRQRARDHAASHGAQVVSLRPVETSARSRRPPPSLPPLREAA